MLEDFPLQQCLGSAFSIQQPQSQAAFDRCVVRCVAQPHAANSASAAKPHGGQRTASTCFGVTSPILIRKDYRNSSRKGVRSETLGPNVRDVRLRPTNRPLAAGGRLFSPSRAGNNQKRHAQETEPAPQPLPSVHAALSLRRSSAAIVLASLWGTFLIISRRSSAGRPHAR
jgi:hypothetical protein